MVYKCSVCGYVFDEKEEGRSFSELTECPLCKQPVEKFEQISPEGAEESVSPEGAAAGNPSEDLDLSYPKETRRTDSNYRYMKEIHEMAVTGKSAIEAMGTQRKMPDWDDILVLGAQLNPPPLEEHAEVSLKTVIGIHAKQPMELEMPVYISHMSLVSFPKRQRQLSPKEAPWQGRRCVAAKAEFCRRKRRLLTNTYLNMCPIYTA